MISLARFFFAMLGEVRRVVEVDLERQGRLHGGLESIRCEMEMVHALIKDSKEEYRSAVQEVRILQLNELAYDIEDFVEDLWVPGKYGLVLVALGTDSRPHQLDSIARFEQKVSNLRKDWKESAESASKVVLDPADYCSGSSGGAPWTAVEKDPEVIDEPKRKLVELLSPLPAELRVISILGCRGVGKTALARAIYEDNHVCGPFQYVAWIDASSCNDAGALLSKAPEDAKTSQGDAGTAAVANLDSIPADKRYLVFVDDVRQLCALDGTVEALRRKCSNCPDNVRSSRIIVTTSVHSVSLACSPGSYVYKMQCLDNVKSTNLFWKKVGFQRPPESALDKDSESILSKCDGLPLALKSVAEYLSKKGIHLEGRDCKEVGQNLGRKYLSGEHDAFREMRRALTLQCYSSLPDYDDRACLLYLSVFPSSHLINSKSLVRRLMAEGLVPSAEDGSNCLEKLIDQCIIDPVLFSSDSRDAKRCKVSGIVQEYIIQKSVSKNVVTLIQKEGVRKVDSTVARVRRLSAQSRTICHEVSRCDVRSLTIFNSVSDFQSCSRLRLLDLEGCTEVRSSLDGICGLRLLKYLSLRKTDVNMIPNEIEKLSRLETLDIRETQVEKLPLQVIMLPKLTYLYGKFELPNVTEVTKPLLHFLRKESVLHTLAGVVINKKQCKEMVILGAGKLKKLKVWCNINDDDVATSCRVPEFASSSGASSSRPSVKRKVCPMITLDKIRQPLKLKKVDSVKNSNPHCKEAEEGQSYKFDFMRLLKKYTSLESISIESSGLLCTDFMGYIGEEGAISCIKLRGKLDHLPDPRRMNELVSINKLQLFSTGLGSKDLSALQKLSCLEYLKLAEVDGDRFCNGAFSVEKDGFRSLKRLCMEAPKLPKMKFEGEAMPVLISLQLLCQDPRQVQEAAEAIEGILHLECLNEVVLHRRALAAVKAWESVVSEHRRRPRVELAQY